MIECVGRREAQGRGGGLSWGSEEEYMGIYENVWSDYRWDPLFWEIRAFVNQDLTVQSCLLCRTV